MTRFREHCTVEESEIEAKKLEIAQKLLIVNKAMLKEKFKDEEDRFNLVVRDVFKAVSGVVEDGEEGEDVEEKVLEGFEEFKKGVLDGESEIGKVVIQIKF